VVAGGALEHNETFLIAQELLFGISALITFFSIFLYANRKRQMMAVKGAILLTVLGLITIAVDYFISSGKVGVTNLSFDPFAVIGTVVLILQVMGHKGIRSDEKLVREADRLR
jgi:peptidoglycan/LPS O-acetylase OafA/YrhL